MIDMLIVIVVLVCGFLVIFEILSLFEGKSNSVSRVNLYSVIEAMVEKHKWTLERASKAEVEYRKFLALIKQNAGFMIVPWLDEKGRDDLDQFWHQHILDTQKYENDCKQIFGKIIHHDPHVAKGSDKEKQAAKMTLELRGKTFKKDDAVYGKPPATQYVSSCGAVVDVSNSHCDSSQSHCDSGGHDGGGGHSCGGHSCGHGCGGH